MILSLRSLLPILTLFAVSIVVPRLLGRLLPETHRAVWLNGVLSALILWGFSALWMFASYIWQDSRLLTLFGLAPGQSLLHFARLGLMAGLIWAPVGLLSLSTVPGRWKVGEW